MLLSFIIILTSHYLSTIRNRKSSSICPLFVIEVYKYSVRFKDLDNQDRRDRLVAVLRKLVSESNYTHRSLAVALKVSKSQVGLTLTGERRVEFTRIVDWLDALDTSMKDFLELLDSPVDPE